MVQHLAPTVDQVDDDALRRFLDPAAGFPKVRDIQSAAALFTRGPRSGWVQGISQAGDQLRSLHVAQLHREFFVSVSAGTIALRMEDPMRTERTRSDPLRGQFGKGAMYAEADCSPAGWTWRTQRTEGPIGPGLPGGHAVGQVIGDVLQLKRFYEDDGETPVIGGRRSDRVITSWSAKSRARMTRTLSELDYAPLFEAGRPPAMVTLTYPGRWQLVAPSGAAVKAHLQALLKAWGRKWSSDRRPPAVLWKLEFQKRGAPHLHLFATIPADEKAFRAWLSVAWADIVASEFCGLDCWSEASVLPCCERGRHYRAGTGIDRKQGARMTDPKRLAVYFAKHGGAAGGKEYQHTVPVEWRHPDRGPGRFWGYRGVERVRQEVHIDVRTYVQLRRTMRRLSRSRRLTSDFRVDRGVRVDEATGEIRTSRRKVRRRRVQMRRGGLTGGFLLVNDGPALATALARI